MAEWAQVLGVSRALCCQIGATLQVLGWETGSLVSPTAGSGRILLVVTKRTIGHQDIMAHGLREHVWFQQGKPPRLCSSTPSQTRTGGLA